VKKASPKSSVHQTPTGGWRVFVGGAAGKMFALIRVAEDGTSSFLVGLQRSRAYTNDETDELVSDMFVAFGRARGVNNWRSGL
jgi:hypothetical protein